MNEREIEALFRDNLKGEKKNKEPKLQKEEGWKSSLKTLAFAVVLAVGIRSFFIEPFHIPSGSMKPGLLVGDYIFVSKMSYGYSKHSFPFSSFNLFDGRFFAKNDPKRGDVVVFRLPSDPSINYIKRIVGLPNDKIKVIDGTLYINNEKIDKQFIGNFIDVNDSDKEITQEIPIFGETIADKKYLVLDQYQDLPQDNTLEYIVPEGHYFAMGDNRDNSQDSRFQNEVGFIPKDNLVGRATMIFFSTEETIWKFWKWHKSIRFKRIFSKIH